MNKSPALKRTLDLVGSLLGLLLLSPVLLLTVLAIYLEDRGFPFYIAPRVGRGGNNFRMLKFRSMVINADKNKVNSTAADDRRITRTGHFIRRFKLDEFSQLWNVLKGEMSLVGPRPNVPCEVELYTSEERRLLSVAPGITDIASIVFADEGEILRGKPDPDLSYNQLIRPWKNRLGLVYIEKQSLLLDLKLIALTVLTIVSRDRALALTSSLLRSLGVDPTLCAVARRDRPLVPAAPPGASQIIGAEGQIAANS